MLPQRSHKDARRVTRKRGVYYFRRRMPGCDQGEVALSLRTRNFREAEFLAARLDGEFETTVTRMSEAKNVAEVLRVYLRELLADDDARRLNTPSGRPIDAFLADHLAASPGPTAVAGTAIANGFVATSGD